MDHKVEVKEEPVWLEETASTSFDNYEPASDEMHLKEETKSELAEPGQTQVNTFEPFTDVKDEICIDEHTVCQLIPSLKEEDKT
ncbi:uncharacterized protein [Anabrus simplex]|uniref:uncharacterized protein isoform X4 n=1 Tax=Anabrus simplex TaxID=316456 RepID=UPI0035A29FFA